MKDADGSIPGGRFGTGIGSSNSATNRVSFLCRVSLARRKLEQRCGRLLAGVLALLANQAPNEIVHTCRRYVAQGAEINIARRLAP
jgi:hypothetical protein